jgi:hypothetical protein
MRSWILKSVQLRLRQRARRPSAQLDQPGSVIHELHTVALYQVTVATMEPSMAHALTCNIMQLTQQGHAHHHPHLLLVIKKTHTT